MDILIYGFIYAGSALMLVNILRYIRFKRRLSASGHFEREQTVLSIPIALLILFLAGYLAVGLFGKPDLVIASILLGGSVFVFMMLLMLTHAINRIQENERLEARVSAAEEASRAKTFFLSNMSHDIRTPLNAILGYTKLARGAGVSPEQQRDYLGKIESAGGQLLDIVNDILEMSRIESGRLTLEPEPNSITACMSEAADLVRTQLESRGINFTSVCEAQHEWVSFDRPQLNRALMNLLCNAGKFTGEGGSVTLSLAETASTADAATYEIRVSDTGIGMSPEFVENLFRPFERERTSTVSRIQGTGLGMAITRGIIDLMGGRIDVKTEKGVGTEFIITVELPLAQLPAPAAETDSAAAEQSAGGARLLLVEDNAVNLEIAQLILQQAGFEIETAENGQLALKALEAHAPDYYDAVLMDIQMPVMDGYTAARAIRALPDRALASIPIIAMTANAFKEDVEAAKAAGMDAHVAKPLDMDSLISTINKVLDSKR